MAEQGKDWAEVADRLAAGDELAFLEMSRLVTTFLTCWRAYDFRDEWPDIIQEALMALTKAMREGRLRDPGLVVGYVRNVARNKFMDRLRSQYRHEGRTLAWDEATRADEPDASGSAARNEIVVDVRRALEKLPEDKRKVVFEVYGVGRTYEQVSKETGIPLGTVKRYLRDSLVELRQHLSRPGGFG